MATTRICSIPNCGKAHAARGWCPKHYARWKTYGDPLLGGWPKLRCSVEGCERGRIRKGLCSAHSRRLKRHGDPLGGHRPRGEAMQYLNEVVLAYDGDECLPWPYSKNLQGYGTIRCDGRSQNVSRVVCEKVHGAPASPDHDAAHSCGKGHEACVTPRHLSWKTRADNHADKILHGTMNRGQRNGSAKLSADQVKEIFSADRNIFHRVLAAQYGVSNQTICNIRKGKNWGWLPK